MEIFIFWIIFSIVIGAIGSTRNIGFGGAFFLSLILSPLIGIIFTLTSKSLDDVERDKQLLKNSENQQGYSWVRPKPEQSVADELEKLKNMFLNNDLTEEEYTKAKQKILSN